jgi:hypothetical protein
MVSLLLMALLFLFPLLFFLFFGPVIRLFGACSFSFANSMAFAEFDAHRRPVNRLYFFRRAFLHEPTPPVTWHEIGARRPRREADPAILPPYFNGVNAVSRICVSSASVITAAPMT